ncbi:MAG TPA: hypothetical protein VLW85_20185 [Myxococcales bacterium]|nr:hypothetical protein [Myxococcales bacterium]
MPADDAPQNEVTVVSRERAQIRKRESRVTLSAWRVELVLPDGRRGAIVHAEPHFRAEGVLLGATQEKLAELWRATLPKDAPSEEPPQQLG